MADDFRKSGMPTTGGSGIVSKAYVNVLDVKVVKLVVLAAWFVGSAVAMYWATTLTGRTNIEWNPTEDSWAEDNKKAVKAMYPERVDQSVFLVAVQWKNRSFADPAVPITHVTGPLDPNVVYPPDYPARGLTGTGTSNFTYALRQETYNHWCNVSYAVTQPTCNNKIVSGFDGYWTLYAYDPSAGDILRAPYSKGYRSTIININVQGENVDIEDREKDFNKWLEDKVAELNTQFLEPLGMEGSVFSIAGGVDDILDTVVADLLLADGIAIPLSLIFAMIVLRNIRLMVLPMLCIAVTTIISMAIVAEIAQHVLMNVIVTPVMISLVVGLPVGHCLFLLNRFREALLEGEDCKEAVERMLSTGGTTITLSQLTLSLCALVIAFVDVDQVQGLGRAMLVSVIVAFLSAVLLVPAVLLTFPEFFEAATKRTALFGKGRETVALASRLKGGNNAGNQEGRASIVPDLQQDLEDTLWHRYAAVTQMATFQNAIIVTMIIILVIPFGVVLLNHTNLTDSLEVYFPRRDTFTENAERLLEDYGNGAVTQFVIMVKPPAANPLPYFLMTPDFDNIVNMQFNEIALGMMDEMEKLPGYSPLGAIGGYNWMGVRFNSSSQRECGLWFAWAANGLVTPMPTDYDPSCSWRGVCSYAYAPQALYVGPPGGFVFNTSDPTTQDLYMSASVITMKTDIDPMGPEGYKFVEAFEDWSKGYNKKGGAQVYMTGAGVSSYSAVKRVSDAWSWMSPVFVLIGFLVLLAGTRSVLVGLRAVFTTFLTIVFALGFTSLTYCHGALDWTGISALQTFRTREGSEGAVHYFVFVITVPLLIGLSMCHELFLISTAHDWYHYHKLTTKEATKMALIGTGWMNIVSGFILAVSFVGHMLSRLPILNQISFAMFWALLFDVLIVRTMLVPTLMAPCGKYNWWPAMDRYTKYAEAEDIDAQTLSPKFETPNPAV
eukprot:TRINITY_DN452_c0_g1_i6.p1 TRINITY_DN452_c0_g1~~TRINITY_DN452_c0_g1_i6.p1  ORF type:complete len:965 (+),score=361.05 TRINITY_DN452_c0_g1_i6:52-2895(+)